MDFTFNLSRPLDVSELEHVNIIKSLREHGIAVLRGYLHRQTANDIATVAKYCCNDSFNAGFANFTEIRARKLRHVTEFHSPFFVSAGATAVVANHSLIRLIEEYLGEPAVITNSLFQVSRPRSDRAIDWHVDLGANKYLNPADAKYETRRLRSIVYLTDVETGGLEYIVDSTSAAHHFRLDDKASFAASVADGLRESRDHQVLEPKGTLILFDTHGLHRPAPLNSERIVLNTWFGPKSSPFQSPPVLWCRENLPSGSENISYVFNGPRDFWRSVPLRGAVRAERKIFSWLRGKLVGFLS